MPNKPPVLLLLAAANGAGTTYDLGATPGANQVNFQVSAPGTVTASTVTINGSNDGSTFIPIAVISNTTSASGSVKDPPYRYFNAVLSAYAGSGNVKCTVELAYRK